MRTGSAERTRLSRATGGGGASVLDGGEVEVVASSDSPLEREKQEDENRSVTSSRSSARGLDRDRDEKTKTKDGRKRLTDIEEFQQSRSRSWERIGIDRWRAVKETRGEKKR